MLVVNRFRVEESQLGSFRDDLDRVVRALAERPGFESADAGRNLDEPDLWVLVSRWADVGSYRRALSAYDVKVALAAIQLRALDEPSAYEPATGELNRNVPR